MSHNRGKGDGDRDGDGRKDQQNKVCTLKGMKDRRIRLSANTAIQFYDVQDRLGYDRASKAIDWLLKEAKVAIDALHPLPSTTSSWNQDEAISCSFNNYPFGFGFGLMNLKPERENHPVTVPEEINRFLDFSWNPNYNTGGEGFASASVREPLQSSFLDPIADNGLLGFPNFQQEIQVQEDEEEDDT